MTITYVHGDPLLTQAQILAFGYNALGRSEVGPLETELHNRYPAAFATFSKQCRAQRIKAGQLWLWHESQPKLGFMVVRESAVGATRLRYVDALALLLARDYQRDNIQNIAIAPLGDPAEWLYIKPVLEQWLKPSSLPCTIYESYCPGVAAEAS
jgi:hypothetical protein